MNPLARFFTLAPLLVCLAAPAAQAIQLEEGDVIFGQSGTSRVWLYRPSTDEGHIVTSLETAGGDPGFTAGNVALGPDDAIYAARHLHLIRIDPRDGFRRLVESALETPDQPNALRHLRGFAHSPYTRRLYGISHLALAEIFVDGSQPEILNGNLGLQGPDLVLATDEDAFFFRASDPILTAPLSGSPVTVYADARRMRDLAVAPDGTLFALDSVATDENGALFGGIFRVPEGGNPSQLHEVSGPNRGQGPPLSLPGFRIGARALLAGETGTLYVTSSGNPTRLLAVDVATGDREVIFSVENFNEFDLGFAGGFVVWPGDVPQDRDGDGHPDGLDNCPDFPNPLQADFDGDGVGDLCNDDEDLDGDEFGDALDNCPSVGNPDQEDFDDNGVGDACNGFEDPDDDEVGNSLDNCPGVPNAGQEDFDGNGVGDVCNDFEDRDGDDIADDLDNCPDDFDPTQGDTDGDGVEDACDPFPAEPDNDKGQCFADLAVCQEISPFIDEDGDGEHDPTDRCPDTATGATVDPAGCSIDQFCAEFDGRRWPDWIRCLRADWNADSIFRGGACTLEIVTVRPWNIACVPR